ncbi:acylphosphatase [Archaeoglobales archaeon ex4484_92]|nr:MAG: acylphosphatase [Archaeoglobales archaeon ex4484_92]
MSMRKKIRIIGSKVHDIGYRYFLMENALAFGIEKFRAVNIEDEKQTVEFYVEGEDEAVNEFCKFAKSNFPPDAVVDEVKVEDYKGYVPKIETFALVFNIGQSRKFIEYGKQVLNKQDKMLEKQDSMLGKIDLMLKKQDETIKAVREVGEGVDKVGEKLEGLRQDLKAYLDERFKKIEIEIERIKEVVGLK